MGIVQDILTRITTPAGSNSPEAAGARVANASREALAQHLHGTNDLTSLLPEQHVALEREYKALMTGTPAYENARQVLAQRYANQGFNGELSSLSGPQNRRVKDILGTFLKTGEMPTYVDNTPGLRQALQELAEHPVPIPAAAAPVMAAAPVVAPVVEAPVAVAEPVVAPVVEVPAAAVAAAPVTAPVVAAAPAAAPRSVFDRLFRRDSAEMNSARVPNASREALAQSMHGTDITNLTPNQQGQLERRYKKLMSETPAFASAKEALATHRYPHFTGDLQALTPTENRVLNEHLKTFLHTGEMPSYAANNPELRQAFQALADHPVPIPAAAAPVVAPVVTAAPVVAAPIVEAPAAAVAAAPARRTLLDRLLRRNLPDVEVVPVVAATPVVAAPIVEAPAAAVAAAPARRTLLDRLLRRNLPVADVASPAGIDAILGTGHRMSPVDSHGREVHEVLAQIPSINGATGQTLASEAAIAAAPVAAAPVAAAPVAAAPVAAAPVAAAPVVAATPAAATKPGWFKRIFGGGNREIPNGNSDTGAFLARNAAGEIELPEFLKQEPAAAVVAPAAPAVAPAAPAVVAPAAPAVAAAEVAHIVPAATTSAPVRPAIVAGGAGSVPHVPVTAAPKVPFFHPERMGGKLISGGKKAGAAALIAASVIGIGAYIAMSARGREFREEDRQTAQIPPMLTPQDLMMQATGQDLAGPADGRGEFEFRNRVNASRGQVLEQPALNAAQPRMSAIDPQSVAELGAPKPMSV